MKAKIFIEEASKGGPGLCGYAYRAALYCAACGRSIIREIADDIGAGIADTDDLSFSDSELVPQPIFFGESDQPEHCDHCGEYIYGPDEEDA